MNNLLVFDGGNQNTLAIVRHLGKEYPELKIHCIISNRLAPASKSRFVHTSHLLPSLKKNEDLFTKALMELIDTCSINMIMPVGSNSFSFCIKNKEQLSSKVSFMLPPEESFFIAESKIKTYDLAEQLDVPYPKTYKISEKEKVKKYDGSYPVVIKAPFEMGKNVVSYAFNYEDLQQKFGQMCEQNNFKEPDLPLLQEFVAGDGYGFFAFYKNGISQCCFMHKRIREFPVKGGASTCAQSYEDEELKLYGTRLLDHLKWHGPAMVEFKRDKTTGQYKLMEINPKFWGSLELAITAGINFPKYVLEEISGKPNTSYPQTYKKTRFQWLLNGEWLHFFYRPWNFFSIFADLFRSKSDFWWTDIKPNLLQLILIPLRLFKKQ